METGTLQKRVLINLQLSLLEFSYVKRFRYMVVLHGKTSFWTKNYRPILISERRFERMCINTIVILESILTQNLPFCWYSNHKVKLINQGSSTFIFLRSFSSIVPVDFSAQNISYKLCKTEFSQIF